MEDWDGPSADEEEDVLSRLEKCLKNIGCINDRYYHGEELFIKGMDIVSNEDIMNSPKAGSSSMKSKLESLNWNIENISVEAVKKHLEDIKLYIRYLESWKKRSDISLNSCLKSNQMDVSIKLEALQSRID